MGTAQDHGSGLSTVRSHIKACPECLDFTEPQEMLVPTRATPICTTKTKQLAQDASEEASREGLEGQTEKISISIPKKLCQIHPITPEGSEMLSSSAGRGAGREVQPQTVLVINSLSR